MATKHFVDDFGAPIDGTSNASGAVDSWLTYAIANDGSRLIIPAEQYHLAGTNALGLGVRNCVIQAERGAEFDVMFIGHAGVIAEDRLHSARIQTVSAGATSVSLVTPAQASRFSVNQWILVGGPSLQNFGYPGNQQWNNFRKITGISSGDLSFSEPLRNSYKSTWPLADPDGNLAGDLGGPATAWALGSDFDAEQVYCGLTATQSDEVNVGAGRSLIIESMRFTGEGPAISGGVSVLVNNTDFGNQNEVDKGIDILEYRDCFSTTGIKQILIQSASVRKLILKRCALTTLNGTAGTTIIDGGSIDVLIGGAPNYGRSSHIILRNNPTIGAAHASGHKNDPADLTFSAGVFRIANSSNGNALPLFVPGFQYVYGYYDGSVHIQPDSGSRITFFVTDLTQDAIYTYIHVDLSSVPSRTYASGNAPNAIFAYGCRFVNDGALAALTAFMEPASSNRSFVCDFS